MAKNLFNHNVQLVPLNIKNAEIKIDGEKVGKLIAPSVGKEFSNKI